MTYVRYFSKCKFSRSEAGLQKKIWLDMTNSPQVRILFFVNGGRILLLSLIEIGEKLGVTSFQKLPKF